MNVIHIKWAATVQRHYLSSVRYAYHNIYISLSKRLSILRHEESRS